MSERFVQAMESRRLLASSPFGTYRGTASVTFEGATQSESIDVVLSAPPKKTSGLTTQQSSSMLIQQAIRLGLGEFAQVAIATNLQLFVTSQTGLWTGGVQNKVVNEAVQLNNGSLQLTGEITTGILSNVSFNFGGTKITPKKTASAEATRTALDVRQALKVNPVFGTFKGHMTRASDSDSFKTSAVVANNKKGHPAITLDLVEPDLGDLLISSVILPTSKGSFSVTLGTSQNPGTLAGHITHTGRLVLHLTVPGVSDLVGSQKRH